MESLIFLDKPIPAIRELTCQAAIVNGYEAGKATSSEAIQMLAQVMSFYNYQLSENEVASIVAWFKENYGRP